LADLLKVAVGSAGPTIAAGAAVVLTLATTNAYITGATTLASALRNRRQGAVNAKDLMDPKDPKDPKDTSYLLQLSIAAAGVLLLTGYATGMVGTARLVALPTTLFVTVYLGCTAAAVRILTGHTRVVAAIAFLVVAGVLAFAGWALAVSLLVCALGAWGSGVRRVLPAARFEWRADSVATQADEASRDADADACASVAGAVG
jgi:amino acid efflux transporter